MATKKWLRSDAPFNPLSNLGKTFPAEDMSLVCFVFVCFWFFLYFYTTIILILGVELLHIRSASNSLWKTCQFNRSPFTHAAAYRFQPFQCSGPLWHLEIHIALEALDLGYSVLTNSTIFASTKKREAAKSISSYADLSGSIYKDTQKWLEFLGFIALIFISHYFVEEPSLYQRTNSYHESLLKLIQKSCWQASSSGIHLLKMLEEWMSVSQHCLGP